MWLDLLFFLPMAVLCNTAFPISFDPVLIAYASTHSLHAGYVFAIIGSLCAGLAGVADAKLLGCAQGHVSERWLKWLPYWHGRRFYVLTFFFAVMPLPFSVVRLAVLRHQPQIVPYVAAVILGCLPRYILTVVFWQFCVRLFET